MEKFAQAYRRVCLVTGFVAASSLAIMIISTTLDTTLRYTFGFLIPGVFELNEVLMVVLVFLGITWTQLERGHTRIIMVMRKMPIRRAIKMDIICWALCILFLFVLGYQSGREALRAYEISEFRWGAVQMPIWWAKALVPLGCWMTCVQLLIDIWVDIGRLKGVYPLDLPDFSQIGE